MNNYIIHDNDGRIVSCGTLQYQSDQRLSDSHTQIWTDFPADIENYRVIDGELVSISDVEIREREEQESWVLFRSLRDSRLSDCDWTQVPDAPVNQAAWATYRQALRDLPANTEDPANPVWPIQPS